MQAYIFYYNSSITYIMSSKRTESGILEPAGWLMQYHHALEPHTKYKDISHMIGDARCKAELAVRIDLFLVPGTLRPDNPEQFYTDKIAIMVKQRRILSESNIDFEPPATEEEIVQALRKIAGRISFAVEKSVLDEVQRIYENYFIKLCDPSRARRNRSAEDDITRKELYDKCQAAIQDVDHIIQSWLQADANSDNWMFDTNVLNNFRDIEYDGDDDVEMFWDISTALQVKNAARCVVTRLLEAIEKMREVDEIDSCESERSSRT